MLDGLLFPLTDKIEALCTKVQGVFLASVIRLKYDVKEVCGGDVMYINYANDKYDVQMITVVKIWRYKVCLFIFRLAHLGRRLAKYLFTLQNLILILLVIFCFVISLYTESKTSVEYGWTIFWNVFDKNKNIILFTLIFPILMTCITKEGERKRKLEKRFWAWYCIDIQINALIKRLFGDDDEYLSLSTYSGKGEPSSFVKSKVNNLTLKDETLFEIAYKIQIVVKNSLDYDLTDQEIEDLQEYCMKIDRAITKILTSSLSNTDANINFLTYVIINLRDLDQLLGKIWTRYTKYNRKIIKLIESEDESIKKSREYKRYVH